MKAPRRVGAVGEKIMNQVSRKAMLGCGVALAILALATGAAAQQRSFNVPAEEAARSIPDFARQADIQIVAPVTQLRGVRTMAVRGDMDVRQALGLLLQGTGLEIASDDGSTIVLRRASGQAAPAEETATVVDEIVVSGSRLARPGGDSSTPVSVLSAEQIAASGTLVIEDFLTQQPQFVGSQTARSNNPGTGSAQIDLRGLGPKRTLILVNGRRYIYFASDQVTDINTIPSALVERVDVLTGGASAVYGSDAVAGVVNFVLKDRFDGLQLSAQVGGDTRGSALSRNVDLTWGADLPGGRGNVVIYANAYDRGGIRQSERGYSQDTLSDNWDADGNPILLGRGSLNSPNGAFSNIPFGAALNASNMAGLRNALAAAGLSGMGSTGFTFDGAGSTARVHQDPADRYNFAPLNYLQVPAERYGVSGFVNYELSPSATLYGEAAYYRSLVDMQLAETNVNRIFAIDVDNPYVSPAIREVFRQLDLVETGAARNDGRVNLRLQRRFTEFGPRQALIQRESMRVGGGLRGELGDFSDRFLRNLKYDVSYFFSRTDNDNELNRMISLSGFTAGLLRPAPGQDPLVNPFGDGAISDQAVTALEMDTSSPSFTSMKVVNAYVTSDILSLPAGVLRGSLGFEWRDSKSDYRPDPALASGDALGFDRTDPSSGELGVTEVFGELRAPLLSQMSPIGGLTTNLGFRYSDYDTAGIGGVWTYLGGAEWSPTTELMLRGQYQRAVRAPNIGELFGGQWEDRPRAPDPCAQVTAATDATLRDLCIATGVPANMVGQAYLQAGDRLDAVFGSNPELDVETADTLTFGASYAPSWAPGLTLYADAFNIEVKDAIAPFAGGVASILSLCYEVIQDANSNVCAAVRRNPTDGSISAPYGIRAANSNIGAYKTSGVDFGARYVFTQPFSIDLRGTWLRAYDVTPLQDLPEETYQCEGAFGLTCGEARPEFKVVTRLNWTPGDWNIGLQHRYLSAVTDDRVLLPRRSGLAGPSESEMAAARMGDHHYVDLSISYDWRSVRVFGGVRNLFDVQPPIVGSSQQQANTYPSTYDALGSEFFFGVRKTF